MAQGPFSAIFGQTAFLTPSFLCIIRFSTLQKPLVRASTTQIRPFWGVFWRFRRHVRLPDRSGRCPKLKWRFLSRGTSELKNSFTFMHLRVLPRLSRAHSASSDRGRICTWLLCRVRRPRHVSLTLSHVKSCVCVSGGRRQSLGMTTNTITAAAAAAYTASCCQQLTSQWSGPWPKALHFLGFM